MAKKIEKEIELSEDVKPVKAEKKEVKKTVKVRLLRYATNDSKFYSPGDEVELDNKIASVWIKLKVGEEC